MKIKRQTADQPAKSIRELAKRCGISHVATGKLLKRDGCPIGGKPPWNAEGVATFQAWRATLQQDRAATPPNTIDNQLKHERMLKIRVERQQKEGTLVPRELLDKALLALTDMFVAEAEALPTSMALPLADQRPARVEKLLEEWADGVRTKLAGHRALQLELAEQGVG